jgi:hypothetical protein
MTNPREPWAVDVLLMAFTRPDLLRLAIEPLLGGGVNRVFLALDGPRTDHQQDAGLIATCEQLVTSAFAGQIEVEVLRRSRNLGMKMACVEAIDWFFSRTDAGVIIEDDCVVDPSFLRFAGEMLERYRDDSRVMGVCGVRYPGSPLPPGGASYSLTRNFSVWGWGTWSRAWQHNDPDVSRTDDAEIRAVLASQPAATLPFRRWWFRLFRGCKNGNNVNWDFPWILSAWKMNGMFLRPNCNLVKNIGHDDRATQTTGFHPLLSALETEPLRFPIRHPSLLEPDVAFDVWRDRRLTGIGWALEAKTLARALLMRFGAGTPP